jgi:uncharacterized protein (DUF1501 family)
MKKSRRVFLRRSGCALGGAIFASTVNRFGVVNALAQNLKPSAAAPDYKALVCIYLGGGNDANNMVVPVDSYQAPDGSPDGYPAYAAARGPLVIPQGSLLPISPVGLGRTFGLHPNMSQLQTLFANQRLAVLCNVGTLYAPMTRTQYLNGSVTKPDNLFSHDDQTDQYQSAVMTGTQISPPTGWGGRLADGTGMLNGGATFPMIVSVSGAPLFGTTNLTRPLVPGSNLSGFPNPPTSDARYNAMQYLMTIDRGPTLVNSQSDVMQRAVANMTLLNQALNDSSAVTTAFPNTGIGNQLRSIARTIAKRSTLFGLQRQIFFASLGGFDTHTGQVSAHTTLFTQLSAAMKAFYDATVELGVASSVTTFTMSDFSRTLKPTEDGSDHAWGSHQFIMGDAVIGGRFYGSYPSLKTGALNDSGTEGRWIPTTGLDQYGATLARWFGLADADLPTVFPNLVRFPATNLGFLP